MEIGLVTDEAGIARCYPLMSQLRPHLSREAFLAAVLRMEVAQGYRLVQLEDGGELHVLAGIRLGEWLHRGRYLEVDDLVTAEGGARAVTAGLCWAGSPITRGSRAATSCGWCPACSASMRTASMSGKACATKPSISRWTWARSQGMRRTLGNHLSTHWPPLVRQKSGLRPSPHPKANPRLCQPFAAEPGTP